MTTEEKEKEKFLNELTELYNLITHNEHLQIIFWISIWIFIMAIWTYYALFIGDILSIVGGIFFDCLGIFYIYYEIKKWKAIKLYTIKTN